MIWLVGNRGMLGSELGSLFEREGLSFVGSDRELSILDPGALAAFAAGKDIGWIVNCAAYTAVDRAEDEPELARLLNVEGPRNLARLATALGASLLHISTDYVFSGLGDKPWNEDDAPGPTGVYGRTKAGGEAAALEACDRMVIVRTAWLYGKHGPNFVYTMLRLMKERESVGVVADQRGSPTWAADLAEAIRRIVTAAKPTYGIYHFTDEGEISWHEFAVEIHRLARELGILERDCAIKALRSEEFPTKARRPAYSVLAKGKIAAEYGIKPPGWKESLQSHFEDSFRLFDDLRNLSALATYDLETAEAMLDARRYLYVAFALQQAIEKNIKALRCLSAAPSRHHNLGRLALECAIVLSPSERRLLDVLSEFYLKGRYEFDMKRLSVLSSRLEVENLLNEGRELCAKLRRHPIFSIL